MTDEALMGLEQRLARASAAAERLLADAVARVGGESDPEADAAVMADGWDTGSGSDTSSGSDTGWDSGSGSDTDGGSETTADQAGEGRRTPPGGWQQSGGERPRGGLLGEDGDLLLGLLASLRDRIPPDLQRRLAEAVREVLLALRALIDWYLERSERRRSQPVEVRDIPIL